MIRKLANSFKKEPSGGIKHKVVAKCLIKWLTKLNMLGASCGSSCN